ncbi:hypothetical protein K458DRAFT_390331 [Lentithecium fluviatile CBS 122367]|uniref:Uncharacterized protein n=1 Tax=Lentithecium fluviatile CBS 122367 TaxID=1168545 RepID=A0A6G1IYK8_9PLEO|nr:hypothetical protein K458DRAFT_390331 [Lentithecium fluviatile CBS 122367]
MEPCAEDEAIRSLRRTEGAEVDLEEVIWQRRSRSILLSWCNFPLLYGLWAMKPLCWTLPPTEPKHLHGVYLTIAGCPVDFRRFNEWQKWAPRNGRMSTNKCVAKLIFNYTWPVARGSVAHSWNTLGTPDGAMESISIPIPAPTGRASTIDITISIMAFVFCTILVAGARYWRGGWRFPAPVMGISSVAFSVLRETAGVLGLPPHMGNRDYILCWTANHRLPPGRYPSYVLASTVLMGFLAYIFATLLREPTTTFIPALTAFSAFVYKFALQTRCTCLNDSSEHPHHVSDTHRGLEHLYRLNTVTRLPPNGLGHTHSLGNTV